jgi:hypothetical protein
MDEEHYLTAGKCYVVLGMSIYESMLCFLIQDDTGAPRFSPAGMFECVDQQIPVNWRFSLREGIRASGSDLWKNPCVAMWGYNELVGDIGHASALGEREPQALQIFFRELRRREAEGSE